MAPANYDNSAHSTYLLWHGLVVIHMLMSSLYHHPHDFSIMQCYMDITKQSTWAENSEHANGSGHVHMFILGEAIWYLINCKMVQK